MSKFGRRGANEESLSSRLRFRGSSVAIQLKASSEARYDASSLKQYLTEREQLFIQNSRYLLYNIHFDVVSNIFLLLNSSEPDSTLILHTPLNSFVSLASILSLSPHPPPLLLHLANPFRNRFRTEFFESPTCCDVCDDEQ